MEVTAEVLREAAFEPFGRLFRLGGRASADEPQGCIVRSEGPGWSDAYTAAPLLSTNGSLGMTRGGPSPFVTWQMERHLHTEEALFCAADPIVLAVAAPSDADHPSADSIRAFIIEPGMVVVLHKGTWHDACHGLDKETCYYWMATCRTGASSTTAASPWVEVKGGPVQISVRRLAERAADV